MKKIYFLLILIAELAAAQSRVTSTGISIRAIARSESRQSLSDQTNLDINVKIYALENSQKNYVIQKTGTVSTDNFGLFSYVVNLNENEFSLFNTFELYIEVSGGDVIYVDEKLQTVPFAIHTISAQNGFQSGAIIPFLGTTAPEGWLICDGSTFPEDDYHGKLISILGSNRTPNLKAMFVRGAESQTVPQLGTSGNSNFGVNGKTYNGGELGTYHIDRYKSHSHVINSLTGSPADNTDSSNWSGGTNNNNVLSPGGQNFQYFVDRVKDLVINGDQSPNSKKIADINNNAQGTLINASRGYGWDGAYNNSVAVGSTSDPRIQDINVLKHQHRFYGKTWYEPYATPSSPSTAALIPPGKSESETAPISYLVNYIIKI